MSVGAAAPPPPAGDRRPWVLLRGLARDQRHWGDLPARLQAVLPAGTPVLALDAPGNGARWRERSPARVDAMAQDARAQLAARGATGPVHVLALSLGAMVAVDWAARHPAELASLVLVNTSLRPFSPPWQRLRAANWPRLLKLLLTRPDAATLERAVLQLTSARPDAHAAQVLPAWVRWRAQAPVRPANVARQLAAAARCRAPRTPPPLPITWLVGAGDRLVDPRCTDRAAAAWGGPVRRHPWAGHDLPLDDPDWVVSAVLQHVAARA